MGCIRDSIIEYLRGAGIAEHIIDHFDIVGEGIDAETVAFYHDTDDWICVMTCEDGLQVPLRVPKGCPPEILTKELRDALIAGILEEFNEQRRRKRAIEEFNQPTPEPAGRTLN